MSRHYRERRRGAGVQALKIQFLSVRVLIIKRLPLKKDGELKQE